MQNTILAPAAVLVLWSIVMVIWMASARLPALKKAGIDMSKAVGGRGADLEGVLPAEVNWKAHNYAHLMEQPTIFYATVAILALAGVGGGINTMLAWGYVGIRIVHSIVQSTVNKISIRFPLFVISTLFLAAMAINALRATI